MIRYINRIFLNMNRSQKRYIVFIIDFLLLFTSVWFAYLLRISFPSGFFWSDIFPLAIMAAISGVFILWLTGFYNALIRAFEFRTVNLLLFGVIVTAMMMYTYSYLSPETFLPRSVPLIFVLLALVSIGTSRIIARWYYQVLRGKNPFKKSVFIYGAGEAGMQLAASMSGSREFALVGFIDDDTRLQGKFIRGRRVYSPGQLPEAVRKYVDPKIIISIANLSSSDKRRILEELRPLNLEIDVIPALADIIAGRVEISEFRHLEIEDLLGRDAIPPRPELFEEALSGKRVMVTGGGGSIGSQIVREVMNTGAASVLIADANEYALYKIQEELLAETKVSTHTPQIEFVLLDITDENLVRDVMQSHRPDVVYNAAALKHVHFAEANIVSAAKTNVCGAINICRQAALAGSRHVIHISTDKAVRPTSIMGASKYLAECFINAMAEDYPQTIFAMVRFGNVLGSSGSVVPKFQRQIETGGPVTVTEENATRYFMTISEAAQLVIQAGFMAQRGDMFVLDMGEPVKIRELAELLIQLSGKTLRSVENPTGDIEIVYTGLRPGEKVYEELMAGGTGSPSEHPKIIRVRERADPKFNVDLEEQALKRAIMAVDRKAIRAMLEQHAGIASNKDAIFAMKASG